MIIIWFLLILPISLIFHRRLSINFRNVYGKIINSSIREQYCALRVKVFFKYICMSFQRFCTILFCGAQTTVFGETTFDYNTVYWRETFCRSCCRKLNIFFTGKKSVIGNIQATQLILCQLLKVHRHVSLISTSISTSISTQISTSISTSSQLHFNHISSSLQTQPQINLNLNLNLSSIWL